MAVDGGLIFDIVRLDRIHVAQKLALINESDYLVAGQLLTKMCPR